VERLTTRSDDELLREALRMERMYLETPARAARNNEFECTPYRTQIERIDVLLARLALKPSFPDRRVANSTATNPIVPPLPAQVPGH
jgi:hypothetical protein